MTERIVKKREVMLMLGVTDYGYKKLLADGTLPRPFRQRPGSHPVHSLSQVQAAQKKILEMGQQVKITSIKCRPFSRKLVNEIGTAATEGKVKEKRVNVSVTAL
jgi:hypothetical protein